MSESADSKDVAFIGHTDVAVDGIPGVVAVRPGNSLGKFVTQVKGSVFFLEPSIIQDVRFDGLDDGVITYNVWAAAIDNAVGTHVHKVHGYVIPKTLAPGIQSSVAIGIVPNDGCDGSRQERSLLQLLDMRGNSGDSPSTVIYE